MRDRAQLIDALASGGGPTGYWSPGTLALLWLAGTWTFVVTLTLLVAPLRPSSLGQLLTSGQFAVESFVGLLAGVVTIGSGVWLGFPRPVPAWRAVAVAAGTLALWLGLQTYGLWDPALEPSMLGKRDFCAFEVLIYGAPPMLAGLLILRGRAAFERVWAGALVGAASGAVPGLFMQLACMYVPQHILFHHLGPVAVLSAAGAALGPLLLRRI